MPHFSDLGLLIKWQLKLLLLPCSFSSRSKLSNKTGIKSFGHHLAPQINLLSPAIKLSSCSRNYPVLWDRFYYLWTNLGTLKYIFGEPFELFSEPKGLIGPRMHASTLEGSILFRQSFQFKFWPLGLFGPYLSNRRSKSTETFSIGKYTP